MRNKQQLVSLCNARWNEPSYLKPAYTPQCVGVCVYVCDGVYVGVFVQASVIRREYVCVYVQKTEGRSIEE